jgi:hypothetical protein
MQVKMNHWFVCLGLVVFGAGCASAGHHEMAAPSEEEMMAKWMAFATPGAGHEVLAQKVGSWDLEWSMFGPDGSSMGASKGTSEAKLIMDGRYLQDTTQGDAMGMPFLGVGTTGFDNIKQKYVSTWVDNMGTGITYAEGTYDAATKTFHYEWDVPDPMQGEYVDARGTERFLDKDHWVMESFTEGPDGKAYKSMEIRYTRKG